MSQQSQMSMPGEWPAVSSPDNGQCYQSTWHGQGQGAPVTTQGIAALDTASFLSVPSSTVSSVLSPVLSHDSQSQDTLTSFSEPDLCELPPVLDLSFATEPAWSYPGPLNYSGADVPTSVPGLGFTPLSDQSSYSLAYTMAPTSAIVPGTHGPLFYPQGGQVAYPKRSASYPHTAPMRPIRPRADGSTVSSQSVHGQQQAERPQMPASHGSQYTVSSVSSAAGHPRTVASCASSGPMQTANTVPSVPCGYTGYGAPASLVSDPTDEDFSAYIHYDHEDHSAPMGAMRLEKLCLVSFRDTDSLSSFTSNYGISSTLPAGVQESAKPNVPVVQPTRKAISQGSSAPTSLTSENDEGRHRTHPLYSEGPHSDGLYYCPYKAKDPNCPHKPTKLKCNYEYDLVEPLTNFACLADHIRRSSKFIDSHLKPFRCKVESCAKQEFSSTACLLRHEREAHGMHGHGERPHLCHYPGCERSAPGNGFPRRYNLFDHMKRVHDHKEDLADHAGSTMMGAEGQKKAGARKRKPSNSPPAPAAQRPKAMPLPSQHAQAMFYRTPGYGPQSVYDASQWTNQSALLAKQMDIAQRQTAEPRRFSAHAQRR